jgi:hypothetical protein
MNITEQLQIMKQPVLIQCGGEKMCSKVDLETPFTASIVEGGGEFLPHYCKVYAFPTAKWRNGNCNMADHLEIETKKDTKKVNPLKASKRGGK